MPKPSAVLREMQRKADAKAKMQYNQKLSILQQMCIDAAFLAAADVFQMGPGRCEIFGQTMLGYINEMALLMKEDAKDDPDLVYTQAKVDQRLRQICGKKFDPWEVRYRDDN